MSNTGVCELNMLAYLFFERMHLTVNGYLVMLMLPCYQTDIKLLMLYICAYRNFDRRVYQFSSWFIQGCPYF